MHVVNKCSRCRAPLDIASFVSIGALSLSQKKDGAESFACGMTLHCLRNFSNIGILGELQKEEKTIEKKITHQKRKQKTANEADERKNLQY